jgi:hypothetical protein
MQDSGFQDEILTFEKSLGYFEFDKRAVESRRGCEGGVLLVSSCLTHRYRCLAKARELPQEIACVRWNRAASVSTIATTTLVRCRFFLPHTPFAASTAR